MPDVLPGLALGVWLVALAIRTHPRLRAWAPRGIAGRGAAARSGRAPEPIGAPGPVDAPEPVDAGRRPRGALAEASSGGGRSGSYGG